MALRILIILIALTGLLRPHSARAEELTIVANSSVTVSAPLPMRRLAAIYLLRITRWPDGSHIVPVNREAASAARAMFNARVLRQSGRSLAAYWNEMHFRGKLPPVVQQSDDAMLAFIRKVPGAIGYVSASTPPVGVRVLGHVR